MDIFIGYSFKTLVFMDMAAARKFYAALIFPKIQFLLHFGLRKMLSFLRKMLSFLRKMLSFCAKCCLFENRSLRKFEKSCAAKLKIEFSDSLVNAANRKNPVFSKNFFPKRQNWTFLKMSKNQIFKILFDKKTLNEIFHKKKPDKQYEYI